MSAPSPSSLTDVVNQTILAKPSIQIFDVQITQPPAPAPIFTPLTPAPPVSPAAIPEAITHAFDAKAKTETDYALPACLCLLLIAAIIGFIAKKKSAT